MNMNIGPSDFTAFSKLRTPSTYDSVSDRDLDNILRLVQGNGGDVENILLGKSNQIANAAFANDVFAPVSTILGQPLDRNVWHAMRFTDINNEQDTLIANSAIQQEKQYLLAFLQKLQINDFRGIATLLVDKLKLPQELAEKMALPIFNKLRELYPMIQQQVTAMLDRLTATQANLNQARQLNDSQQKTLNDTTKKAISFG